jgi:amino acid transporter
VDARSDGEGAKGGLRRVLSLWDLILYGIVLIMPIGAAPLFGIVQQLSHGQAVSTLLLAMVAMTLTAYSYGRLASLHPLAGSAYTFVGSELNAHLGFLAGWAMFLDYLLVPVVCILYASLALQRLVPGLPYWFWCALIACILTAINLGGIRATANMNLLFLAAALAVILPFLGLAAKWLYLRAGWPGLLSTQPFYSRDAFHLKYLASGTAVAALTYGGFDGISTLSEEARNPQRDILLATVFVCIFTGIFGGLQIYLAQRVLPGYRHLAHVDTAFLDAAETVGGPRLFHGLAVVLVATNLGSGLTAQAGVSRLLYRMGRDGALPRFPFSRIGSARAVPVYNVLLVGALAFGGCLWLSYERAAELINFGAFLAFMGVNASAIRAFYWRRAKGNRNALFDLAAPAAGFVFCLYIWLNLGREAKLVGAVWFAAGLLFDAILTKGFTVSPSAIRLDP